MESCLLGCDLENRKLCSLERTRPVRGSRKTRRANKPWNFNHRLFEKLKIQLELHLNNYVHSCEMHNDNPSGENVNPLAVMASYAMFLRCGACRNINLRCHPATQLVLVNRENQMHFWMLLKLSNFSNFHRCKEE